MCIFNDGGYGEVYEGKFFGLRKSHGRAAGPIIEGCEFSCFVELHVSVCVSDEGGRVGAVLRPRGRATLHIGRRAAFLLGFLLSIFLFIISAFSDIVASIYREIHIDPSSFHLI